MHEDVAGEGGLGVGQGRHHVPVDVDGGSGRAGMFVGVRHDDRDGIADVARDLAHGDQQRPVLMDEPGATLTWHVRGREDAHDARHRCGAAGAKRAKQGPRMFRKAQGTVQEAGKPQVVHEGATAEGLVESAVLGCVYRGRRRFAAQHRGSLHHGVDDRVVAGATANVMAQRGDHLVSRRRGVLRQQHTRARQISRRAESALHRAVAHERLADDRAHGRGQSLDRGHGSAREGAHGGEAGELGATVDLDGARAASALARAAVLGGGEPTLVAQPGEEGAARVAVVDRRLAIECKFHGHHQNHNAWAHGSQ